MPGLVTLIGSGEVSAGMTEVHRALLARLGEAPHPAFIDTPAGFELGLPAIHERFRQYVAHHLGLPLAVVAYHSADDDPACIAEALQAIARSNYFLAGPGSPTYAVQQWQESSVLGATVHRWQAGAQLIWASSAAIALGRHVAPVYEVYKVGQPPHWEAGLDLLGPFGLELAIIPHWDNAEGGTHDTRACFLGMDRFMQMKAMLPSTAVVLGIDEHTAVSIDLDAGQAQVRGRGGATILRADSRAEYPSGSAFPLSELRSPGLRPMAEERPLEAAPCPHAMLAAASERIAAGDLALGLQLAAQLAPADLGPVLLQAAQAVSSAAVSNSPADLLSILVDTRDALRRAGQWELADQLRDRLASLGVSLQDTPTGTVCTRVPDAKQAP